MLMFKCCMFYDINTQKYSSNLCLEGKIKGKSCIFWVVGCQILPQCYTKAHFGITLVKHFVFILLEIPKVCKKKNAQSFQNERFSKKLKNLI